jgi:hypothetical protein
MELSIQGRSNAVPCPANEREMSPPHEEKSVRQDGSVSVRARPQFRVLFRPGMMPACDWSAAVEMRRVKEQRFRSDPSARREVTGGSVAASAASNSTSGAAVS